MGIFIKSFIFKTEILEDCIVYLTPSYKECELIIYKQHKFIEVHYTYPYKPLFCTSQNNNYSFDTLYQLIDLIKDCKLLGSQTLHKTLN